MSDTSLDTELIRREREKFAAAGREIERLKVEARRIDAEIMRQRGPLGDIWRQMYIDGKLPQ